MENHNIVLLDNTILAKLLLINIIIKNNCVNTFFSDYENE